MGNKENEEIIKYFLRCDEKKIRNRKVIVEKHEYMEGVLQSKLYLHGNLIAIYQPAHHLIKINDSGWNTLTTKRLLNTIPYVKITQKKGIWYLNCPGHTNYVMKLGEWVKFYIG